MKTPTASNHIVVTLTSIAQVSDTRDCLLVRSAVAMPWRQNGQWYASRSDWTSDEAIYVVNNMKSKAITCMRALPFDEEIPVHRLNREVLHGVLLFPDIVTSLTTSMSNTAIAYVNLQECISQQQAVITELESIMLAWRRMHGVLCFVQLSHCAE